MLEIAVNKRQMKKIERTLAGVPRAMPKVMSRAINKVAVATRTKIVRTVAAEINMKQKDLKSKSRRRTGNVRLVKASYKRLTAKILISGGRIPLIRFGAKKGLKGVRYRIKRSGDRKMIPGTFIATMKSGHTAVVKRAGKPRLPIIELFGPSLPVVFEGLRELAEATLDRTITEKLQKEIGVQIGLVLERSKAG